MRICYGWSKKEFYMSQENRYLPEQLYDRLKPFVQDKLQSITAPALLEVPLWVHVDTSYIRIENPQELNMACKLVAACHNTDSRAPISDGWDEEIFEMEEDAARWVLRDDNSDEDGKDKGQC